METYRLQQRIMRALHLANRHFSLIDEGDKIMVALSGGKDSYGLLWALQKMQAEVAFRFELVAYHLDQGQPGHNPEALTQHCLNVGVPFELEYQDTYSRVVEKTEPGKIYCSLCSRYRRAILYKAAARLGANKVALGHHREDIIETLLLNIFFAGQIKAMPAKLKSEDSEMWLIRPFCYVQEENLRELAEKLQFSLLPCRLCGSQAARRSYIKDLLGQLEKSSPHIKGNILASLSNLVPSHLLLLDQTDTAKPAPEPSLSPLTTLTSVKHGHHPRLTVLTPTSSAS